MGSIPAMWKYANSFVMQEQPHNWTEQAISNDNIETDYYGLIGSNCSKAIVCYIRLSLHEIFYIVCLCACTIIEMWPWLGASDVCAESN